MTTDLTPEQIAELLHEADIILANDYDEQDMERVMDRHLPMFVDIVRQLQREKQELEKNWYGLKDAVWDTCQQDYELGCALQRTPIGKFLELL